jgi:hypothetical protein
LHGQIEIDNNLAENAIRPIAIGRKAFLFAGSHQAAEMTAAMYSFMATCKKNGVDEQQWLTDVFERIQSHKHKDLYQLLPNCLFQLKSIPHFQFKSIPFYFCLQQQTSSWGYPHELVCSGL